MQPREDHIIDPGFPKPETPETLPPQEEVDEIGNALRVIGQWRRILSARLIALLAIIGALGIYGFTMFDPSVLRLIGAGLYAMVLWPALWLCNKKG